MKRKIAYILLGLLITGSLMTACGKKNKATEAAEESEATEKEGNGEDTAADPKEDDKEETEEKELIQRICVIMPGDRGDTRWNTDADIMEQRFFEKDYASDFFYSGYDSGRQIEQIRDSIREDTAAIVIAPVDPYSLTEVLDEVKEQGIPVFDYNELIMNTDALKYFITFNTRESGHLMGEQLRKDLSLEKMAEDAEPLQIEFLTGRPDSVSSLFLYNGLMEQLSPDFESGRLVIGSGKDSFDQNSVMDGSSSLSEQELTERAEEFYTDQSLDILCLAGQEQTKAGVQFSREQKDRTEDVPVVQTLEEVEREDALSRELYLIAADSSSGTIQSLADGEIDAVIFEDARDLAEKCAETVLLYLGDEDPEVSDYEQYDNGTKIIRTVTCDPEIVTQDNFGVLIDNGAFAEGEIRITEVTTELTEEESTELPVQTTTEAEREETTESVPVTTTELVEETTAEVPEMTEQTTETEKAEETEGPAEKKTENKKKVSLQKET